MLQPLYGGALARPFTTHHNALDRDLYLRIATELYLKRLIVGGLERVYELGKDFRNEGISHKHNPEFTMVEWYEAYADYEDARRAPKRSSRGRRGGRRLRRRARPLAARGRASASRRRSARRPGSTCSRAPRPPRRWPRDRATPGSTSTDGRGLAEMADDLLSKYVEPTLHAADVRLRLPGRALAACARTPPPTPALVERWEAFAGGMEIANAFSELIDPDEQRERFAAQQRVGAAPGDEETQPYDEAFVQALEQGMPPTGGVGLGIDRLVMLLTGRDSIREVVLFPAMRD